MTDWTDLPLDAAAAAALKISISAFHNLKRQNSLYKKKK